MQTFLRGGKSLCYRQSKPVEVAKVESVRPTEVSPVCKQKSQEGCGQSDTACDLQSEDSCSLSSCTKKALISAACESGDSRNIQDSASRPQQTTNSTVNGAHTR